MAKTLHPRALEQLLAPHRHRDDPRPSVEGHGDYGFGVLLVPILLPDGLEVRYQEVDVVAAPDVVLNVRKTCGAQGPFDGAAVRALHGSGRASSAGLVVYHLADEVAEGFLDLTDRLNERIDVLEDHVEDWDNERARGELRPCVTTSCTCAGLSPTRDASCAGSSTTGSTCRSAVRSSTARGGCTSPTRTRSCFARARPSTLARPAGGGSRLPPGRRSRTTRTRS